jgi:hypothetical protein
MMQASPFGLPTPMAEQWDPQLLPLLSEAKENKEYNYRPLKFVVETGDCYIN